MKKYIMAGLIALVMFVSGVLFSLGVADQVSPAYAMFPKQFANDTSNSRYQAPDPSTLVLIALGYACVGVYAAYRRKHQR